MKDIFENINKAFENKVRLGVMSILMVNTWYDFNGFKELLGVTDGNLASHLANLEKIEFIEIKKEFVGKKTKTSYKASSKGKKAFKNQAIKWHPDKNPSMDTTLRMQEINEAYLILKDLEARKRYDIEYRKFKKIQDDKVHEPSNNLETEYQYTDYEVEDDVLKKWMDNAKKQAVDLAQQTIRDFKGVSKAVFGGLLNGIVYFIGGQIGLFIFFLLVWF